MPVARIVRGARRALAGTLALAVLAGCAPGDAVLDQAGAGYVRQAPERMAAVDWARAETVTVTMTEFAFSPAGLVFRKGVPYRLRLVNAGARDHTFVSEGFFKAIRAAKLVSAEDVIDTPYLRTVAVPAGAEREIHFVPVRAGAYPLECSVFLHAAFGMEGEIAIR